jgi:hypothetical protein
VDKAAAAPNPDATYWVGPVGAKPVKMTVKELQVMADSKPGIAGIKVMKLPNTWVSLAESGLVKLPERKTAPTASADEPPAVPDDEPPAVPADADNTVADTGGVTRDGMKARLFPDAKMFDGLDAALKKKAEDLIDRAWNATSHGRNAELPDDVVNGLMELAV